MIAVLTLVLLLIFICGDLDRHPHRISSLFKISLYLILAIIIGVRIDVGIDYDAYVFIFNHPNSFRALTIEPIWRILVIFLHRFSHNPQGFFLICAIFTMMCYCKAIQKLSPAFYLSTLFLVLTGFYFETANTVRQCAAMSILMWGYSYWLNKDWKGFIAFSIGAFFLHYSSIFGVALICISGININKWWLSGILVFTALFGAPLMNFAYTVVMPLITSTGLYNYTTDQFDPGISSGVLKYLYTLLGIVLIFICSKDTSPDRFKIHSLLHLTIYGLMIYNIFYTFQPARRLYSYGFMFIILLLPYFFKLLRPAERYISLGTIVAVFTVLLIKSIQEVAYNFEFVYL